MLASADLKAEEAGLLAAARRLGVPLRLVASDEICETRCAISTLPRRARESQFARRRRTGGLAGGKEDAITTPQDDAPRRHRGDRPGKLYAVGIGPGGRQHRTYRAVEAIAESQVIVGYRRYLELIADLTAGKELLASGMTAEVERCRAALTRAAQGQTVALISSGDAGIYGMAGLAIELAAAEKLDVPIEVVPGVTAAIAAAAALGAPLMLDFAAVSLSDLLVPWEVIRRRLQAVADADLVAVLYNPRSQKRVRQLDEAVADLPRRPPRHDPGGRGRLRRTGRSNARPHRFGPPAPAADRHEEHGCHRQQRHPHDRRPHGHAARISAMILLLGGESSTAEIARGLAGIGCRVLVSRATRDSAGRGRGRRDREPLGAAGRRRAGRTDRRAAIRAVVDATHPYATTIRRTARRAAERMNIPYLSFLRPAAIDPQAAGRAVRRRP